MKVGQPSDNLTSVQSNNAAALQKTAQGGNPAATAKASAAQSTRSAGVAVMVSTQTRGLEKAARSDATADVDTQKVATIKAAIQNGSYKVNAEAIADNLLSNAQEMLDRRIG